MSIAEGADLKQVIMGVIAAGVVNTGGNSKRSFTPSLGSSLPILNSVLDASQPWCQSRMEIKSDSRIKSSPRKPHRRTFPRTTSQTTCCNPPKCLGRRIIHSRSRNSGDPPNQHVPRCCSASKYWQRHPFGGYNYSER